MNLLQLVIKQMRQRSLSTWLTLLSVLLGVALAIAILIFRRESGALFGQNDYGFDVLIGAKGSPTQLVLNTIYHIDKSPGNITYSIYENLANPRNPFAKVAVPYAVGDSYKGERIVGTATKLFGITEEGNPLPPDRVLEYRPGKRFEIDQGKVFHHKKFEAVIGSEIPARTGLKLGDTFQVTHGMPQPGEKPDIHAETWTVVGILKPTNTANDRVLFIPLTSFYCLTEHDDALVAQQALRDGKDPLAAIRERKQAASTQPDEHDEHAGHDHGDEEKNYHMHDGEIHLELPKEVWALSAVLVRSRSAPIAMQLIYSIKNGPAAEAVNPATVMRDFFGTFLKGPTLLLLVVAILVTIVAAVGILVSIYNSVAARKREIAILRALGATRTKVLLLICIEAGLIGLAGGVLGLLAGHAIAAAGSAALDRFVGESINYLHIGREEWLYLVAVVAVAVLAGLVPAMKAYKTPVATNLVAS